jgi:hypothetical protein
MVIDVALDLPNSSRPERPSSSDGVMRRPRPLSEPSDDDEIVAIAQHEIEGIWTQDCRCCEGRGWRFRRSVAKHCSEVWDAELARVLTPSLCRECGGSGLDDHADKRRRRVA